ncbi:MAG: hypothetical protein ACFE7R_03390 [Candidatus Hodarchaeota archaeon]
MTEEGPTPSNDAEGYYIPDFYRPRFSYIVSIVLAIAMVAILTWLPFELVRRLQSEDYSLFGILIILFSGGLAVVCFMITKRGEF